MYCSVFREKLLNSVRTVESYGLSYMAAKNIIGPITVGFFYLALKKGVNIQQFIEIVTFGMSRKSQTIANVGSSIGRMS